MNFYKGNIEPEEDVVFVFGSNPEGRHGKGAAKIAIEKFGARYGIGEGLCGNSYALPTKDLKKAKELGLYIPTPSFGLLLEDFYKDDFTKLLQCYLERSIKPEVIIESIRRLYDTAIKNPDKKFKIAYRNKLNQLSLNGYLGGEMREMFILAGSIPKNIFFSEEWKKINERGK